MKQMLDTHVFIWFVMGNPKISATIRTQIEDNENMLSIASVWEMAIKQSIGKLNISIPIEIFVEQHINRNAIKLLDIKVEHLAIVTTLPFHHRDPFDRLLIAQAMVEKIPVLSADSAFDAYSIHRLWS